MRRSSTFMYHESPDYPFALLWRSMAGKICMFFFFIFVLDKMEQKWTIAGLPLRPFLGFCVW